MKEEERKNEKTRETLSIGQFFHLSIRFFFSFFQNILEIFSPHPRWRNWGATGCPCKNYEGLRDPASQPASHFSSIAY